ncbi:TonB-dependent receptor [Stieleria sp. ICT_E10.1]|uniref:TonB-dependent receptor n=1 Tax=Stieleria sedimenti TaxID=2976331 RepID=UPI00217F49E7|nr:TonB-dependent receptor [Stieleria sedimenti]MCS7470751.1 TonB-dependent receptor [Stieleria sedimenti]
MFRTRQGSLLPLAIVVLISMPAVMADDPELNEPSVSKPAAGEPAASAPAAGEPEFRLLRIAEDLERLVGTGVMPAQFQEEDLFGSPSATVGQQGIQPIDAGPSGGLESFDTGELSEDFGFGDWSLISRPALSTDTSSLVDSASFIEDLEQVQGTSEVGLSAAPAVDIVTAQTFNLTATPDMGETLVNNSTTQTVRARQRSQVGFDPRIRGFYNGQIYTAHDGSYQFPVRSDLDGVFSKIDQSLIGNVQVYSGPYTVRYGSGFSFLNVDTIPAPRYNCGWENHIRLGTNVRTNGGQTYNTMTLFGGGESLGYFANVGYRKGSDYAAGDGLLVPSSYDAFNLFTGIGYDIDDQTRSELRYTHIDQDNTEYAGQFFDVDDLKSDGLTHSLIHRDDRAGFAYRVDSWVNYTEFNGDTSNSSKRRADFPVLQRVDDALAAVGVHNTGPPTTPVIAAPGQEFFGTVNGDLISAGMRAGVTQEINRDTTLGAGFDLRYVRQEIDESFDLSDFNDQSGNPLLGFNTGLPAAELFEPGLYTEYSFKPKPFLKTAVGARVSFAQTEADPRDVDLGRSNFRDLGTGQINSDLDVSDVLSAFFITNDIDLAPAWKARIGFGYAERLPNLEQRYSDGLFLAIIQNGFSRIIGDPTLSKERNWQVDARVNMEYDYLRARLSGFHSWIVDYVTYQANEVSDPTGAQLLRAINTEYATLTGFEYYCEADLVDGWQVFGTLAYLDGRDREIDQPLSGINPLEGRLGLRLIDTRPENAWGVEWGLRMVDNQDRLATLRTVPPATGVVTLESATPGFTTSYLRGYIRPTNNVNITMGVENLFDNNYYEHLNLRLPAQQLPQSPYGQTVVLSPGITPYFGIEVDY